MESSINLVVHNRSKTASERHLLQRRSHNLSNKVVASKLISILEREAFSPSANPTVITLTLEVMFKESTVSGYMTIINNFTKVSSTQVMGERAINRLNSQTVIWAGIIIPSYYGSIDVQVDLSP